MTENEQRPEDPPSYPKNGTYADLLIWHLKIWWTRPDGSPKSRGTKPWTTSELLSKVFGPNRVDIDNQNNLFKNWTGFKKKERSGSENGRKISHAIFGGQPQFLIWANDLENARVRTNGAGKNRLTYLLNVAWPIWSQMASRHLLQMFRKARTTANTLVQPPAWVFHW